MTEGNGWRKGSRDSSELAGSGGGVGGMKSSWRTNLSSLSSGPGYTSTPQQRHRDTAQSETQVRDSRAEGTDGPQPTTIRRSRVGTAKTSELHKQQRHEHGERDEGCVKIKCDGTMRRERNVQNKVEPPRRQQMIRGLFIH